ncbi:MAG TPA: MotA/TolQ/ExbB proton channel family protein [Opitutaceae bacterium]
MNRIRLRPLHALASLLLLSASARCAETFDDAMKRAAADYGERLKQASVELDGTRKRIADEKAPLLQEMRSAEDRIVTADSQISHLQTGQADSSEERRKLLMDLDAIRKNTTYIGTLAHDGLTAFGESLAPGEGQLLSDRVEELGQKLDDPSAAPSGQAALDIAEFLLERTRRSLGGYSAPGSALIEGNNQVLKGTFAFVGPETYFQADGGAAGTVRPRAGSNFPVAYVLASWNPQDASAFFQGKPGMILADASSGKALRLRETRGTLLEHIQKGGLVAYAIIAVGVLSLVMIVQKIVDLSRLAVDAPQVIRAFLASVAQGDLPKAEQASKGLRAPTRELFQVGLKYAGSPKEILEEHLQAVLLRQRLHFERRLPLLAVIATAAPLMGLLGTVVGMVKTFALITVFGTGNAGKLASGISEVLVATELGLVVAIPTLIAHGFLAHRIQKNLSLLERYALEFVTATDTARASASQIPA